MLNPIRWIADAVGFIRFAFGPRKNFLYSPDDANVRDFFSVEQIFDRRVFVSFERGSLRLAERFEAALRRAGLEPWRYHPSATDPNKSDECHVELAEMKTKYRETVRGLMATVRRCPAVLVIVSERSERSLYCQLEAFTAAVIHGFWPETRVRNEAGVYVVLEQPGVSPLPGLDRFWSRVHQEGLDDALAVVIAREIRRLAEILRAVEEHRAKIYR